MFETSNPKFIESYDIYKSSWSSPDNVTVQDLNFFSNKLKNRDNFSLSRLNDGEWIFMLRIEPYVTDQQKSKNHNDEIFKISDKLKDIITSKPEYYVSISTNYNSTNVLDEYVDPYKKEVPKLVGSGIFNLWSIMNGMEDIIEECSKRKSILVGPKFLCKFAPHDIHYETPQKHVHYHYKTILEDLTSILDKHYEKDMIILYSCSFVAKLAIDMFYKKYGNTITQLDLGSSTSPKCLVKNRPWHNEMFNYYKHKLIKESDTYKVQIGGRSYMDLCFNRGGDKFCQKTKAYQKLTIKSDVKPYLTPSKYNIAPYITSEKIFIDKCLTK